MKRILTISISVIILLSCSLTLLGQGTAADYKRAEKFLRPNVEKRIYHTLVMPNWIEKTARFWYKADTRQGKRFITVDMRKRRQKPAFDHQRLAKELSRLLKKEYKPGQLPFDTFEFTGGGKAITFNVKKQTIKYHFKTHRCETFEKKKKDPDTVALSPDGKWEAFVKEYNLYVRAVASGKETQLTNDGVKDYPYALEWDWYGLINETDPSKTKQSKAIQVEWSPDSARLATYRADYRKARKMYLYQSLPESGYRAQVWSYYRPLPGETGGVTFRYYIFDITTGKKVEVDTGALHSTENWDFPHWFKDGRRLHMFHYHRGYKKISLEEIDAETGKTRTVLEESAKTYIDTDKRFIHVLGEGRELVWGSERDGWSHLYLYDWKTGQLKHQITRGEFVVRELLHVDEKKRRAYFTAGGREKGRDPYLPHLYRINLDGSGLTLLSPENAFHWCRVSPDKKYLVDSYSRVDLPTVTVLRRLKDGKVLMRLPAADIENLTADGWSYPEAFTVKARDGKTDLYGVMFRPSNFDPNKKYPVIDGTYSGPQAVRAPKTFRRGCLNADQAIAELGFVVVTVDGLGTANRSKAFHDFSYKNLGDIGGPDHIAAIKQLAQRYPYLDISRVGIYGHSAGGYDAAHALLVHPDFYKVGVASAGNHDHQMAKAWWPEHYQGYPVEKHYVEQSNLTLAKNLKGKLLLVHGDMDNNVNPASSLRLAAELVKADKDFDLLLIPNRGHSLYDHPYFIRKRWDYFVRHLLEVEPPLYSVASSFSK